MKPFISIMMFSFLISGCATQQFVNSQGGVEKQDKFDHFFVDGIGQEAITNAAAVCGGEDNIASVERSTTFLNWFVSFLSWGIYTPEQSRVNCKK